MSSRVQSHLLPANNSHIATDKIVKSPSISVPVTEWAIKRLAALISVLPYLHTSLVDVKLSHPCLF